MSIVSVVYILLSINSLIFEYSSCDSLKYLPEQIFIKYEQILSTFLVSLICLLNSFICLFLVILIIGKTNSLHNC